MKEMTKSKRKVFEAAVSLFNTKGYSGTSVREIANKAGVNVSLISYYFGGKKGLLEQLMTYFLEGYIETLDQVFQKRDKLTAKACLLEMVKSVLKFEAENYHLARLVHREITLDSLLVREIMTTYLTKEKYYFKTILEIGMKRQELRKLPIMLTIMQLKGMLTMPYLHPQYLAEVLHLQPKENYFTERYYHEIKRWIEGDLSLDDQRSPLLLSGQIK